MSDKIYSKISVYPPSSTRSESLWDMATARMVLRRRTGDGSLC